MTALLQVQQDLERLLQRRPETTDEREAWRAGVTAALVEAARGRLYLARLQASHGAGGVLDDRLAS